MGVDRSVAAELIAQLRDAADNVSDPAERGVILRFVKSVSAGVATAVVTKHAPKSPQLRFKLPGQSYAVLTTPDWSPDLPGSFLVRCP